MIVLAAMIPKLTIMILKLVKADKNGRKIRTKPKKTNSISDNRMNK